jgi:hypothetical protein
MSPFRWAVVALVASMALILPPLAARWTNGYRRPELTAAGIVGANAGYLVAVAAAMPAWVAWAAAAAFGAALFAIGAHRANAR